MQFSSLPHHLFIEYSIKSYSRSSLDGHSNDVKRSGEFHAGQWRVKIQNQVCSNLKKKSEPELKFRYLSDCVFFLEELSLNLLFNSVYLYHKRKGCHR